MLLGCREWCWQEIVSPGCRLLPQDSFLLSLSKPLVGTLFAVLIEGSRIVIVGSILKQNVLGSEQEKEAMQRAKQSERRRMGKA